MAYTTIDDPSAYFHTQLFTGNGSTQSITNDANAGDFKPDWLWIKSRGSTHGHAVFDSNRGGNARLASEGLQEERTNEGNVTFQTDGFNVTSSHPTTNNSSTNMVAWQWKVNGGTTTSFSESGSQIGGTRQVNTTVGISLITYTGNGSSGSTIPHGLSQTPEYVMIKNRGDADEWVANGSVLGNYARLHPNAQSSLATSEGSHDYIKYPDTGSTNLVTGVSHNRSNADGDTYMAWCFHSVQGYSKIAKYTGNGNADGTFVYTGFKPVWIMVKRTDATNHWLLLDVKRADVSDANPVDQWLRADSDDVESSGLTFDFLSNGFKCRSNDPSLNASGGTYFYMAFAESPFVSSEGVPTTAR